DNTSKYLIIKRDSSPTLEEIKYNTPIEYGKIWKNSAALFINETGVNMTVDEFHKERYELNLKKYPFAKLMPGVMRLVTHLKKHQIPMAIASNSFRKFVNIKTSVNRELFNMFDNVTCGDDVKNFKPAPDLFLAAREAI
ncbi:466_t:CDS:2, partial [Gigaspora rosea]